MFSMAVGTFGERLKLVPFFVRVRTVDSGVRGGAGSIFAVKHLMINIMAWVPRKIDK